MKAHNNTTGGRQYMYRHKVENLLTRIIISRLCSISRDPCLRFWPVLCEFFVVSCDIATNTDVDPGGSDLILKYKLLYVVVYAARLYGK